MNVYNFEIILDWKLMKLVSEIDRFDAAWSSIEKKESQSLKELRSVATVKSVGASTRIEGSKMNDAEVDALLNDLKIEKLTDRDSQEVAGYYEVLDLIIDQHVDIKINSSDLFNLHNLLLKYSEKDHWHKGNYKQLSNSVEATMPDGSKKVIFETTPPGYETEDAMRAMIDWYKTDKETHPLVKCALFSYEFVSIHPFQDGNGRLSRLIVTLLLLKLNYNWIQYVSLEHEIENRKTEYYRMLRTSQSQRPGEDVTDWVYFFFDALINIQTKLMQKLESTGITSDLSPKEKSILAFISDHPGTKSGDITNKLDIPKPTVKRAINKLLEAKLIIMHGTGAGTNYSIS